MNTSSYYTTDAQFNSVQLETSIKAFYENSDVSITRICEEMVETWRRLIERSDVINILLWVGEGNEIYEWRGNLDDEVIWCHSVGFNNYDGDNEAKLYDPDNRHYRVNKAVPYRDEIPTMRFSHLKKIIEGFKAAARKAYPEKDVFIGATIDPGPEFAPSRFKVKLHPEVLTPGQREKIPAMMHFMTHQAVLNADDSVYAAYPDGIPEGTRFGEFLGKQFQATIHDLGYDYIWFSNGFAYTHFPWTFLGESFLGEEFDAEQAKVERQKLREFWLDFRAGCPDAPIEVRGSNFSVGMDIATDGCSHDDIFEIGKVVTTPCNPPWGSRALGLEMSSYLSRIAKPQNDDITFRFYLNDVWFSCNAWYDYYNRESFDIHVPMGASRLNSDGGLDTPNRLALLTVDNEYGEYVQQEANEVIPHLIRALDTRADAAAPVIWVYPHDEYHANLHADADKLDRPFAHDWFMTQAINAGLPVTSSCSSDTFVDLQRNNNLPQSIFVMPVPEAGWSYTDAVINYIQNGGQVLFYGALQHADAKLQEFLGVECADALEGEFNITDTAFITDSYEKEVEAPVSQDPLLEAIGMFDDKELATREGERPLMHRALPNAGGLAVVKIAGDVKVRVQQETSERIYAVHRKEDIWQGGAVSWLQGTVHFGTEDRRLEAGRDQPWLYKLTADYARYLLEDFGWSIRYEREDESTAQPYLFIARNKGAFNFLGHKPDSTAGIRVQSPWGAPIWENCQTRIRGGHAEDCFQNTIRNEVRAFVQQDSGKINYTELQIPFGYNRQVVISNLVDANITIFIDPESFASGKYQLTAQISDTEYLEHERVGDLSAIRLHNYTGAIYAVW